MKPLYLSRESRIIRTMMGVLDDLGVEVHWNTALPELDARMKKGDVELAGKMRGVFARLAALGKRPLCGGCRRPLDEERA